MTPLINFTEPLSILTALVLFLLILFLAKESKKSILIAIMLGIFILVLLGHSIEFVLMKNNDTKILIANSITLDFTFIFISYISYLWIDDMEAKYKKKKNLDDSLNWFWKKV